MYGRLNQYKFFKSLFPNNDKSEFFNEPSNDSIIPIFNEPNNILDEKLKNIVDEIYENEIENMEGLAPLLSQILIGMSRDFIWGILTYKNIDLFNGKIGAFWGTTFTQMCLSSLPTFATIKLTNHLQISYFLKNKNEWLKKQSTFACSSWSAIPSWNGAQFVGNWFGQKLGLTDTGASYFSGLFTGVTETLWQGAFVIPRLLNQPIEWGEVLFGSLGGAVWQWVLEANASPNIANNIFPNSTYALTLEEITVGAEIAGTVAVSTLLTALLAREIKKYLNPTQIKSEIDKSSQDQSVNRLHSNQKIYPASPDTLFSISKSKPIDIQKPINDEVPTSPSMQRIEVSI